MYWFTADEHYGHERILVYCGRPYSTVEEMDAALIINHNKVVKDNDMVIHAGDFCLRKEPQKYIKELKGKHVFLKGSHDKWLPKGDYIWEKMIEDVQVVVSHYAMRTWRKSHYNSWQLYGHSHGRLEPIGKQHDVGVDNNGFYPVSFEQIKEIMAKRPDNPNYLRRGRG